MGFAIVCFDVLCSQGGPLLVSLLVWGSIGFWGVYQLYWYFRVCIVLARFVWFVLWLCLCFCLLRLDWDAIGRPLDISLVLWLPWVYPAFHRQAPLVEGFLIVGLASSLVWLSYMSLLVWGTVRVHIPLLDHSWHAHVAPNTGEPRNTHTIMHAAEQYMFCTPRPSLLGENMFGILILNKWTFTALKFSSQVKYEL